MAHAKPSPPTRKLSSLKKWLTVQEAARHLTIVFGEDVSEADVLRFALDGFLTLSVNFVNHAKARGGKVVPIDEAEYSVCPPGFFPNLVLPIKYMDKPISVMRGIKLDDERVLNLDDKVVTLEGVYDLAMLGSGRVHVEEKYQMLTDGPPVRRVTMEGIFVSSNGEVIYQLQEEFDQNELLSKSTGLRRELKAQLQADDPEKPNTRDILEKYLEKVRELEDEEVQRRKAGRESDNYYPAFDLPEGSVFVVRTEALIEFEKSLTVPAEVGDDPITPTERNTLLIIIAALCNYSDIKPAERGAAKQISGLIAEIGAQTTDETVLKYLKMIPDALERRKR